MLLSLINWIAISVLVFTLPQSLNRFHVFGFYKYSVEFTLSQFYSFFSITSLNLSLSTNMPCITQEGCAFCLPVQLICINAMNKYSIEDRNSLCVFFWSPSYMQFEYQQLSGQPSMKLYGKRDTTKRKAKRVRAYLT